jgi:hypothetical protein
MSTCGAGHIGRVTDVQYRPGRWACTVRRLCGAHVRIHLAQLGRREARLSTQAIRRTAEEHPTNIETKKVNRAGGISSQPFQQCETVLGDLYRYRLDGHRQEGAASRT